MRETENRDQVIAMCVVVGDVQCSTSGTPYGSLKNTHAYTSVYAIDKPVGMSEDIVPRRHIMTPT